MCIRDRYIINTITNDEIVTTITGREQTQISRNERKEKEEKHFIERERSLKSARDLDVPRQKKKFKRENAESNRDTKKNKKK